MKFGQSLREIEQELKDVSWGVVVRKRFRWSGLSGGMDGLCCRFTFGRCTLYFRREGVSYTVHLGRGDDNEFVCWF